MNIKGKVVAFVHAKGSSSRVPNKNLRVLGDKPLFCHAIVNAKLCKSIDTVVIDSDSDEILSIGAEFGAIAVKRPPELASNETTGDDLAYWQATLAPESEVVVQVVPTSPFMRPETIDNAVQEVLQNGRDSAVGVFKEALYLWINGKPAYYLADGTIPNSFDMEQTTYETTGLYANRTASVLSGRRRITETNVALVQFSRIESVDINYPEDFELAEIIWRGMRT